MSSPSVRKSLDANEAIDSEKSLEIPQNRQDAFGDEEFAEVKYKVLKWWYVSITLICDSFRTNRFCV